MKKMFLLMLIFIAASNSAKAQDKILYKDAVRCLNVELDGSETLRITGFGRNRRDAKEQAMKNAVYVVLFEGVKDGNKGCNVRPIIENKIQREKFSGFFDSFFKDKGEYKKYVNLKDTRFGSKNKNKTKIGAAYEMTVRVLRSELKTRMKEENIIP
ncbi:MAG: hypothetical protein J6W52_05690 [Bacteroidaceae bacterium]|nr:hypothetical protein [Bacteroidaceae bacterium]